MWIFLYIAAIATANIITASTMPLAVGPLLIPWGSWFIGANFILRDVVQTKFGRKNAYITIVAALAVSAIVSASLGDTMAIVIASAITFIVAETADTEIFTRMKESIFKRVIISGVVGGLLDSVIFVLIGLGPWGAGFLTWDAIPYAIAGQFIIKFVMQFIGALILVKWLGKYIFPQYHSGWGDNYTPTAKEIAEYRRTRL